MVKRRGEIGEREGEWMIEEDIRDIIVTRIVLGNLLFYFVAKSKINPCIGFHGYIRLQLASS